MDSVRYYLALMLVVFTPPAILFWFSIHPLIRFWRRVGPRLTLAIHYALLLLMAGGLFLVRKPLLTVEFGTSPLLIALAVPIFVLAVVLRFKFGKHLRARILKGLPELAPEKYGSRLLNEGIYSRIRHPRYVQVLLALLAYAMVANYLATYILLALSTIWILLLVPIEEKELRDRFGAEYEAYCARVPRFIPRRQDGQPAIGPVAPEERIDILDILRGFALFGILAANMRAFNLPYEAYMAPWAVFHSVPDRVVQALVDTFISGKFITIFAFLFGVGFAIQMDRAASRGARFLSFYAGRLGLLLLIGLAHGLLLWWGDILAVYAAIGFLLLLFRKRKQQTLLIWTISVSLLPLLMMVVFLVLAQLGIRTPAPPDPTKEILERSIRIYSQGAWPEIQRQRLHDWILINRTFIFSVAWILPRFLFGLYVWRSGFIHRLASQRDLLRRICLWGLILGALGNAAGTAIMNVYEPKFSKPDLPLVAAQALYLVAVPLLSASYAAGIALFSMSGGWLRLRRWFQAVGRTALSNYLLQSVVCTMLYYSYGLALFGKVGAALGLIPTALIYAAQLPLSGWWLARFRFGPVEWLWRSLAYGKLQPMRLRAG